jgi:hypothetical protein
LQSRTGSIASLAVLYGEAVGQLWRSVAVQIDSLQPPFLLHFSLRES